MKNISKADIIELLEQSSIDESIKNVLKMKVNEYETNKEISENFIFEKIEIEGNRGTEYPGAKINFDKNKPLTICYGINGTGKTTSFLKIEHFFSRYNSKTPKYLAMQTELSITLRNKKTGEIFIVKYHSKNGFEGNRFKVCRLVDENEIEIKEPETFLKSRKIIENDLNESMFIFEGFGGRSESFVLTHCKDESSFRKLFNNSFINYTIDIVQKEYLGIKEKRKILQELVRAIDNTIKRTEKELEALKESIKRDSFLVENKDKILQSLRLYESIDEKLRIQQGETTKARRGLEKELSMVSSEIRKLNRFNLDDAKDRVDILYSLSPRKCYNCNNHIPPNEFRKRVTDDPNPKCYSCGYHTYDYSDEYQLIPNGNIQNIREKLQTLQEEKSSITDKIEIRKKEEKNVLEKPKGVNKKIWDKIKLFGEKIVKEIEYSEIRLEDDNNKRKNFLEIIEEEKSKQEELQNKIDNLDNTIIELEKLLDSIYEVNLEEYNNFKSRIISQAQDILVELTSSRIGELKFDDDGYLILYRQLNDGEREIDRNNRINATYGGISSGQYRKIDFAFTFAFLKYILENDERSPLAAIFIDDFAHLDEENEKYIIKTLTEVKDIQTILFSIAPPEYIEDEKMKLNKFIQNENIVENDPYQTSLDQFF